MLTQSSFLNVTTLNKLKAKPKIKLKLCEHQAYQITIHYEKKSTKLVSIKVLRLWSGKNLLIFKGQIILKWFFGVFDFLQKMNENKST